MALTALAINCTLKKAPQRSSTNKLLREIMAQFARHDVTGEVLLAADYNILPGVSHDEGEGDQWPEILAKIKAADIFILGTPIWMGQPCSVAKRVCERMDGMALLDGLKVGETIVTKGPLFIDRAAESG